MFGIAVLDARRGVTISVSVVQYPLIIVSAAQGGYYIKLERWCRKARAKHVCAHQGLLQTITKLDQAPLALDASDAEVCAAAEKHAQHCRRKREAMQPVLSVNLTTPIVYAALRVSLRLVSPSSFIACSLCRFFARVSLIRKCNLDGLSRYLLDLTRKLCHLCALLFIGRGYVHGQQLPQGVHRNVDLAAAFALITVIARTCAALAG